jgi:hypothetical protein
MNQAAIDQLVYWTAAFWLTGLTVGLIITFLTGKP